MLLMPSTEATLPHLLPPAPQQGQVAFQYPAEQPSEGTAAQAEGHARAGAGGLADGAANMGNGPALQGSNAANRMAGEPLHYELMSVKRKFSTHTYC